MYRFRISTIALLIVGGGLFLLGTHSARAQTGPGGVGNTTGSSSLELWLKADEGITEDGTGVSTWADQSGNGRDASRNSGDPQLLTNINAINDKPAVQFDGNDGFSITTSANDALESLSASANTVFVVSRRTGNNADGQYTLSVNGADRVVGYEIQVQGTDSNFVAFNKKGVTLNTSTSSFRLGSSLFRGDASGEIDGVLDAGTASSTATDGQTGIAGDVFLGEDGSANNNPYLHGDIAEVIAYSRELNAAEIRIVYNYLAAKYDQSINSSYDFYGFTDNYSNDLVGLGDASSSGAPGGASGPGVAVSGSDNDAAESSILQLNGSLTDAFALFAHDGGSATSFTSSGNPPDAERLKRQWRVDLSGTASETFSASVDLSSVSLSSGFNDFALFIDGDGDFTTSGDRSFHDLEDGNNDGVYTASGITIEDGDRVAVAQINRTVSFATTTKSEFEDTGSSPNASVTVSVNYVDGSDIDVSFSDTGDLDNSTCFEDDQTDQNPNTSCEVQNDNGDFEADDGSGDDDGDSDEGSFNGDYRINTGSPVTIPGGNTSATLDIELDNDALREQSEKFEVNLDGVSAGKASVGAEKTFTFTIYDDDEDRDLKFADPDYTDGTDSDSNYDQTSTEGDGGGSRVEKFTVKMRQDGSGLTASGSSPYTTVDFSVDGASTANFGTDLSDPLVDVKILNESGSGGDEYQERLSPTAGRVHFASDATVSTLKLVINEDDLEDADSENIVLNLENPISSSLVKNDSTQMTFAISDDDAPPNVSFTSTSFSGEESADAKLNVEFDQQAGTGLNVTFKDEGSGTATRGDDYTWPSDSTISVSSGTTKGTFAISVTDDSDVEPNETIDVGIASGGTEPSLGSPPSTSYTIVDNDGIGSMGPGGVGRTDGSGNLSLWLEGDAQVYSGSDCSGSVTDGGGVGCWQDQSGKGNNATAGTKPTYKTGQQNGHPVIRFDGNDDVLTHALTSIGTSNNTVFTLAQTNSTGSQQGIFAVAPKMQGGGAVVTSRTVRFASTDAAEGINGGGDTPNPATGGTPGTSPVILSSSYTDGNTTVDIAVDGGQKATNANASTRSGAEGRIGAEMQADNQENITNTNFLDGDVTAVVAYEAALNTPQRNIVRNYLSAKYDVMLRNNNLYAGDSSAFGHYDHNVIGIGKEGGTGVADVHDRAVGGGLTLSASSLSNNPDYVLIGNKARIDTTNHVNFTGTAGVGGNLKARPDSVQFLSVTGSPTFNLTYDLSEIGLKAKAGEASNYVLMTAGSGSCSPANNDCSWSDAGGAVSVDGDQVTFSDVSVAAGDYYLSIGTTNEVASPLVNTYGRTIVGTSGTDQADGGWRYIGVPVSGATIDDLQPPVSPSRNGFVTHSVAMDYHWSLDDGGTNTDGWTELSSGDPVPNGRGFIVYVYDDPYYPIDTEIPLDVGPNNTGTPGNTNVTVGDGNPGFDTALNVDSTWHLLANPYAASFDLSGNLTGPTGSDLSDSGFSSTIQLWNPDTESYETVTQGTSGDDVANWQGFFVERSSLGSGDSQLTFDAAGRDAGSVGFVGSKKISPTDYRMLGLQLSVHRSGEEVARDEAAGVYFREGAAHAWDGHDASKLVPFSREYATVAPMGRGPGDTTTVPKAIESVPFSPTDTFSVPLDVQLKGVDGEVTLEARDWTNIPASWSVTLVDTKGTEETSDDVEVSWGPDARYTFSSSTSTFKMVEREDSPSVESSVESSGPPSLRSFTRSNAGSVRVQKGTDADTTRFRLRVAPAPVKLKQFKAFSHGQSVKLRWATAAESPGTEYYVEHRRLHTEKTSGVGGGDWVQEGYVAGSGSETYEYELSHVTYGRHAFRLRQVDSTGAAFYSRTQKARVRLDEEYAIVAPYPNPVRREATLEVTVREEQPVRVALYDVLGRRVRTVYNDELPGKETQQMQIRTERLASGVYFVRVRGERFSDTVRMTVVR